jgi:hypothetical protein
MNYTQASMTTAEDQATPDTDLVFQNINLYIILKLRASSNIKMQFYTLDAKNAII